MPEIDTQDMRTLMDHFTNTGGTQIVRATTNDGSPGHPVVFPPATFPALMELSGDEGARSVVKSAKDIQFVALPDQHAMTDLDTPEAWNDWLSNNPDA